MGLMVQAALDLLLTVTDMGSCSVATTNGLVCWSVGTILRWPQSGGRGPAQMAVVYSPGTPPNRPDGDHYSGGVSN